ncbi:MAG TPA: hypothetical protein GX400_21445 [Chloroflexi bacterium]|nr:hypothetical protein [Chloroflexota bacterium]
MESRDWGLVDAIVAYHYPNLANLAFSQSPALQSPISIFLPAKDNLISWPRSSK